MAKKTFLKKGLSVLTAVTIASAFTTGIPFSELDFSITASAAEIVANGTCGAQGNESSVTWSLDSDGTLTISGTGAMADYELVLENSYYYTTPWHDTDNDYQYQNSNIKKVVVEEGVTHIGNSAFKDFTELTSISIPNTVKSIGNGSVSYCRKLESLVIPDSVTSIGEQAFYDNTRLTSVTIGDSVETIGEQAFYGMGRIACTDFTITLPKSVTYIAPDAFMVIYRGATIRYSCSYNEGNGYSTGNSTFYATLVQYHLCEYSSSGNEINCSGCTCGEYSSSTATLSLSSDEPIYYTGEEIKPAVTVTYPDGWGGDKIEPNESNCTYSGNINAGTATCTFKYAEGVEASIDFTIEKSDSVITAAPTPTDLVYDGTALNLINAGTTTDGEMQYSLNGTNYSRTIPTGTDAKTYTVWYKVVGDENHNDTEPESIEVSIAPKSITVTADNASKTYGEDDPTFTYTATGLEVNDTLTGTLSRETGENVGTYAITQGTLANPNYEITFVEGTFTINKATPPALTIPTATTITYGEKLSASTLSDGWAWVDGTIVPNANAYYNAYIEVDDSNYDYTGVDGYDDVNHRVVKGVDVIITRATLTITANSYTIKVGSALPTYKYTVTGLVNGDTLPIDVIISCTADGKTAGTYDIVVSGVAESGNYTFSYVNGTLTVSEKEVVAAPTNLKATGGNGKVTLTWTAVSGATKYRVRRNDGSGWVDYKDVTTNSLVDTGVTNGKKYYYAVYSYVNSTWSKASEIVFATPAIPVAQNVKATAGNTKVTLTWDKVDGATKYRVRRNDGSGWVDYKDVTTNSLVDTGVTNGKKYYYAVYSYVNGTWSKASEIVSATLAIPVAQNVKATAGDGKVTVTWTAVTGATKYRVRRNDGSGWVDYKDVTTNSLVDTGVTNGKKYYYAVYSYVNSTWSKASAVVSSIPVNAVVQNVKATAGDGKVTVTWTAVTGATKYRIRRNDGSGWVDYKDVTTNSLVDTGVTNGKKYYYAVYSYVNGAWSAASAIVNATPSA